MTKRTLRLLVAVPVAVVAVVSGATFFYLRVVNGDQPKALTVTSVMPVTTTTNPTTSVTAATTSAGLDGTWKVHSGQAGYRVKETLFGQSGEAVGRTSSISGTVTISGSTVTAAELSVDMTSLASNEPQRDGQFHGRIMNTSRYPTATFKLTTPIDLGSLPAEGATISLKATGSLTLHGTTRLVTIALTARRSGATIAVAGSLPVTFADYGINNPSGGPASVGNTGTMELAVSLRR